MIWVVCCCVAVHTASEVQDSCSPPTPVAWGDKYEIMGVNNLTLLFKFSLNVPYKQLKWLYFYIYFLFLRIFIYIRDVIPTCVAQFVCVLFSVR